MKNHDYFTIVMFCLFAGAVGFIVYSYTFGYQSHLKEMKTFCHPYFYSTKEYPAHGLERITCIDREGNPIYKFRVVE